MNCLECLSTAGHWYMILICKFYSSLIHLRYYSNSLEQLESDGNSSEDEDSRRKRISEMFNVSYTKVPSPDNSDEEVDPLDSFMAQIEVSMNRSCDLR